MTSYLDFPRMIQLETTVKCNATCVTCPNQFLKRPDMPDDMLLRILEQIVHEPVQELHPFFTNEPFMDRRVWGILDYMQNCAPQIGIHFYSNMSLLGEKWSRRLLEFPNFKFIAFSLDGATKEIFEQARPQLNWDIVKRNCDRFLELRDEMNRRDVHVKAVFTASAINVSDMQLFQEMWNGRVDETMVFGSDSRAFLGTNLRKAREAGKVGLFQNDPRWPCRNHKCHQHSMYILSDGGIVPCCKDTMGETILGNAFETPLREIWHSDKFNQLREKLDQGIYDEKACKLCPMMG